MYQWIVDRPRSATIFQLLANDGFTVKEANERIQGSRRAYEQGNSYSATRQARITHVLNAAT